MSIVKISGNVVKIGATTYQLSNISSVYVTKERMNFFLVVLGIPIGLGFLAFFILGFSGTIDQYGDSVMGIVLLLGFLYGLYLFFFRPTYKLVLRTSSGEAVAYETKDQDSAHAAKRAIENAMQ